MSIKNVSLTGNADFVVSGDPTSRSFDTRLMICLLQNLKGIHITSQLPNIKDDSIGADLSRIKIYRKSIANTNDRGFSNAKFTAYWNDIKAVRTVYSSLMLFIFYQKK